MTRLSPTGRLEWLTQQIYLADAHAIVQKLLSQYEEFLEATNATEAELIERFLDKDKTREYFLSANRFGDSVFEALSRIGLGTPFLRVLVV